MTHEEMMNYCEAIIENLRDYERYEMASPIPDRDVAVAAWVIRQLAMPGLQSERVLEAIMERRKVNITSTVDHAPEI